MKRFEIEKANAYCYVCASFFLGFPPGVSYQESSVSLPPKDDILAKFSTKFYTGASPFPGLFRVLRCGFRAQVLEGSEVGNSHLKVFQNKTFIWNSHLKVFQNKMLHRYIPT